MISKDTWQPSQVKTMTGLPYEQVAELVDLIEDYLDGWQPSYGRRREMELFDAVLATLFYYRHNCSQDVVGAVFGVSQPTISRVLTILEEPIAAVLDCEVPELVEVITGRVVIVRRVALCCIPNYSWEELGGSFLGLMANLDLKSDGNSSMVRHEASCRIPGSAGRNSEVRSWA
jgi:hypothetical protein